MPFEPIMDTIHYSSGNGRAAEPCAVVMAVNQTVAVTKAASQAVTLGVTKTVTIVATK